MEHRSWPYLRLSETPQGGVAVRINAAAEGVRIGPDSRLGSKRLVPTGPLTLGRSARRDSVGEHGAAVEPIGSAASVAISGSVFDPRSDRAGDSWS